MNECWSQRNQVHHPVQTRAATNDYFHNRLICWLFLRLIDWSFIPWNVKKVWKTLISSSHCPMWHFQIAYFVQTTAQNTMTPFLSSRMTKKQQILTFKRLNQQFFLIIHFKNDWNDYQIDYSIIVAALILLHKFLLNVADTNSTFWQ